MSFLGVTLKIFHFFIAKIQAPKISWNFQRTKKFKAFDGDSCHKNIQCIYLFIIIFGLKIILMFGKKILHSRMIYYLVLEKISDV